MTEIFLGDKVHIKIKFVNLNSNKLVFGKSCETERIENFTMQQE